MKKQRTKNPVAKNLNKFNKPATHKDRKKAMKRGEQKYKKFEDAQQTDTSGHTNSSAKKPQNYVGPDGKTKTRMVPVHKDVQNENIDKAQMKLKHAKERQRLKDKHTREREQAVSEKLKVSDGPGEYVKDFRKSDAPQFKGKSDEKKQKMAIAAYLDARRKKGMDEGVELVNEVNLHVRLDHLDGDKRQGKAVDVLKKHEKAGHIKFDGETDKGVAFVAKSRAHATRLSQELRPHATSADIHEAKDYQVKTYKNTLDALRGARYKLNNPVPDRDSKHKTAQQHNKAIGRSLRNEESELEEASQVLIKKMQDLAGGPDKMPRGAEFRALKKRAQDELKKDRAAKKAAPAQKSTTKTSKGKTHTGSSDPADRNIIMQLRKAQDVDGKMDIRVSPTGRTVKLSKGKIDALLKRHDSLPKPRDKRMFTIQLTKALRGQSK